ncbi:NADP-dependent oxidoreductase [Rhodococcus sp. NPDC058521]|uniref:NADP-dependent oxidoreductase n=1 Tax=Rhodococcus sp. NPDC058521 TaxID=3346536 RepID=UPI003665AC4A
MPLAYCFTEYGGPETQQLLEVPMPEAGPGQLQVAVHAAGVNPADWKVREGTRKDSVPVTLPAVLGREVAGVVTAVGERVEGFAVGDHVFGSTATGFGGYAEYTVTNAASTAHKPETLPFTAAAVIPVAVGTAYDALAQLILAEGATLLVVGAGGGVGLAALQLARRSGVRVIAAAGDAKKDLVTSLGATWIASGPGLASRMRDTGPLDIDAVFDVIGADLVELSGLVADPSRLISIGNSLSAQELGGSGVVRRRTTEVFTEVASLVASGAVDPHVRMAVPLAEAGDALARVESGHSTGKVVVEVT